MYATAEFPNDFNPANLSNPSSLQITNQLVARGAGGRGEALRSAPTPQGYRACQGSFSSFPKFLQTLQVSSDSEGSGGPPLPPAPPKIEPKIDQKSNQKKHQIFDPKWPPKGTLKISKI